MVNEQDVGKEVHSAWGRGVLVEVTPNGMARIDLGGFEHVGKAESCFITSEAERLRESLSEPKPAPKNTPNPKQAYGAQKPDMSLVPQVGLIHCAYAMEDGANKYGPYNWRDDPVEARTYVAAAMRHLACWLDGEERTSDTNVSNLGAVMACCAILLDAQALGVLIDNRPKAGAASKVLDELKAEKVAKAAGK